MSCFKEYTAFKDDVIENEQYFLRYLGFDLHVELPYKYLLNMTKFLNGTSSYNIILYPRQNH
jgi:hypothetical protein